MTTATATNVGKIVQIIGPVLDVEFQSEHLPEIYNALERSAVNPTRAPISASSSKCSSTSAATRSARLP